MVSLVARSAALIAFANNYRQRYSPDAQRYSILASVYI